MKNLDKLQDLHQLLKRTRENSFILKAIAALLDSPYNIDLQINAAGLAHADALPPEHKYFLWESMERERPEWASACIDKIVNPGDDRRTPWIAACALLDIDPAPVLEEIRKYSPTLVGTWDMEGADSCGLMLARPEAGSFDCCFYVGWGLRPETGRIVRLDFIESVQPITQPYETWLSRIHSECLVRDSFWASLPTGWGYTNKEWKSFWVEKPFYRDPFGFGYTRDIRKRLGLS